MNNNDLREGEGMTLLEKIDCLMSEKKLNKRKLSIEADIPYTTVDGWYKRGYENISLSTFKKLCRFFDVSMDSMAYDDMQIQPYDPKRIYTTPYEREIILKYRQADNIDQTSICRTLGIDTGAELKKGDEEQAS